MARIFEPVDHNQPNKNWLHGYVYVIDYGDQETYKIGYTTVDPQSRHAQITKGLPVIMPKTALVMSVRTNTNARYLEEILHMKFDDCHIKGEWFQLHFTDLIELYMIVQHLGEVELYDRWFDIVPEDAPLAAKEGSLNWLTSLPHLTKKEKEEFDNFDWSLVNPENYPHMFNKEPVDE